MTDAPLLLLTRAQAQAERFAEQVLQDIELPLEIVIAPVLEMEPVRHRAAAKGDSLILTSENAILNAGAKGFSGQTAYCVGAQTAIAAKEAGLNAISADGDVKELIALIKRDKPKGRLTYLRGEKVSYDLVGALAKAGFDARERVTYRQNPVPIDPMIMTRIDGATNVIIPLFSTNTARHVLSELSVRDGNTYVVAISPTVAEHARAEGFHNITVAANPDSGSMVNAIAEVLMQVSDEGKGGNASTGQASRRGSGAPALLGGIGAAAVGFILAMLVPDGWPIEDNSAALDALQDSSASHSEQLSTVTERLESQEANLEGLIAGQNEAEALRAALASEVSSSLDSIAMQIGDLDARLSELEKQPIEASTASAAAMAAFNRDTESLRQQIEALEHVVAELNRTPSEDVAALLDLSLAELESAIDDGLDYSAQLLKVVEISGQPAPQILTDQSTGIVGLSTLQEAFPDAARAALSVSSATDTGQSGVGAFLRRQLGIRSLTPKEGDSVDAHLSRAEAALQSGELDTVLAELSGLPEESASAMSPWMDQLATHLDLKRALGEYRHTIKQTQE